MPNQPSPILSTSTRLLHDLGVVELSEPIELDEYGTIPELDYLDRYAGKVKQQALFESVGYGPEDSGPKFSAGGDTRKNADRRLISFKGAHGPLLLQDPSGAYGD